MQTSTFISDTDGLRVSTYHWNADAVVDPEADAGADLGSAPEREAPRGIVQLAHGVAEHAGRYERLALELNAVGYEVYAHDHRGHGASVDQATPLGSFGIGGWAGLVADIAQFSRSIRAAHPDLPLFLVAHSMGSFAAQELLLDRSDLYDGVVLSGSTALDVLAGALAESAGDGPVELTAFNAAFENRTGYEWLTRDEAEVDAYVADPLSGFDLADDTVPQLFSAAARLADPLALAGIRSDLPLLIVSGEDDPLSGHGQLVGILESRYTAAGVRDVTLIVYVGARHEIFNETNRADITADVVAWLLARS